MSEERKGVWLDEDTYVDDDGTTHKAVEYIHCSFCSLSGTKSVCLNAKCTALSRKDRLPMMFSKVQKVEVDKCK